MALHPFGEHIISDPLVSDPFGVIHRGVAFKGATFERHLAVRVFSEALSSTDAVRNPQDLSWLDRDGRKGVAPESFQMGLNPEPHATWPYQQGVTLAQWIDTARSEMLPPTVGNALAVLLEMVRAIQNIHDAGLNHGVVTPYGWWVGMDGSVQNVDLAFAPAIQEAAIVDSGIQKAIEPYMADGSVKAVQQDIYALGAIFFEMITMAPLPYCQTPQALETVLDEAKSPHEENDGKVPESLRRIMKRMLLVGEPYESASALLKDVSALAYDEEFETTTFATAFYTSTLFRTRVEQESISVRSEMLGDYSIYAAGMIGKNFLDRDRTDTSGAEVAMVQRFEARKKRNTLVLGVLIAASVVMLVGGAIYTRKNAASDPSVAKAVEQARKESQEIEKMKEEVQQKLQQVAQRKR